MAALQGWIFGLRYWQSATACSFKETLFSGKKITVIGEVVAVLYLIT
jgi:hypothetical protein